MNRISESELVMIRSFLLESGQRGIMLTDVFEGEIRLAIKLASRSMETAHLRLHLRDSRELVWICDLHVAPTQRLQGWGRELVRATEAVGLLLGYRRIHLFPLATVRPFWHRMGYRSSTRASQVFEKTLG